MLSFLLCGIIFLSYSVRKFFKEKILYPSIIFTFMWGFAFVYIALILQGYGENLYLKDYYEFHHLDSYVIFFSIAVLLAFFIAHLFTKRRKIKLLMTYDFINHILNKYRWVMWLNFFGGLLRMALMINQIGLSNIMDYRVAANMMMLTSSFSFVGIVFKLTAYIQMLANFYVGLCGLKSGFERLNFKKILSVFILYAPTQMATGGRLFIFYFILFFFGSFLLGRGLMLRKKKMQLFYSSEKKVLLFSFASLLFFVAFIAMLRSGGINQDKETVFEKFSYVTEGVLATEYLMDYYPSDTYRLELGHNTLGGEYTNQYLDYLISLKSKKMSAVVKCFIVPFYMDYGYWGSILAVFLTLLLIEWIALRSLGHLNVITFFIFLISLKMLYESVISPVISTNMPNYELILIFLILYKPIFGRYENRTKVL